MANHKSAIKRHRQSETRRERNRHVRNGMRTLIKRFSAAAEAGDEAAAQESFGAAERAIRKAATKGVIPQRRADRTIGRLAKRRNAIASS